MNRLPTLTLGLLALLAPAPAPAFDHAHAAWSAVLEPHLRAGALDYAALARDRGPLDAYLGALEAVTAEEYQGFDRGQRLAFWVNAYNAYTVRLVLEHYPVESIRKIGRFWESPFKIAFIPLTRLRGEKISLDVIENQVLRGEIKEPLIHAAIVCASKSCPELRPEAYTAAAVNAELEAAMRGFLADPARNRWDAERRTLHLSSIFKWFHQDFERAHGSLLAFVLAYLPEKTAAEVRAGPEPLVDFLDYDWSLNGRQSPGERAMPKGDRP